MLMKRFYQPAREYRALLKQVAQSMKGTGVAGMSDRGAPVELYRPTVYMDAGSAAAESAGNLLQDLKTEVVS
jgi:hypothetical protein